jgi:Site-specific recombinase XerD
VYYTRIALPQQLRARGFPSDIKISLKTKDKKTGIRRNFALASNIISLIFAVNNLSTPVEFRRLLTKSISDFNKNICIKNIELDEKTLISTETTVPVITQEKLPRKPKKEEKIEKLPEILARFIASKTNEAVTTLTVYQLNQRISHFISCYSNKTPKDISSAEAMSYRDALLAEGRSFKTNKEYLAATKQFFSWCLLMKLCAENPFNGITAGKKPTKRPDQQRLRWKTNELQQLFACSGFQNAGEQFKWATLLMLFHALRPSEACQLHIDDIVNLDGVWCLNINDSHENQRLKNENATRIVPLHKKLISQGLLEYRQQRLYINNNYFFDYKPVTSFLNWSKEYSTQLGEIQSSIEMLPKHRPSAYGFRHTCIDEMQQAGIPEAVVADIVGHNKQGITFQRYGKKATIEKMSEAIEIINF